MAEDLDPELVSQLKQKYGADNLFRVTASGSTFVLRRPTMDEWDVFSVTREKADEAQEAQRQLVRDCCLYPAPAVLEQRFAKLAGLHIPLAMQVAKFAGAIEDATVQGL